MPEIQNSQQPEAIVTVVNRKGLHARASAKFVKTAESFNAHVTVTRDGQSVAAGPGSQLHIRCSGPEGPEALEALVALVEMGFGEELAEEG
jgi:phosphocarrier protein